MNAATFSWLGTFLTDFWSCLRAWTVVPGVSLYAVLLAVALIIIVIRSLLLKG